MKMKILSLLMLFCLSSMYAQKPKGTQRIESMKIAFITQELALTTDEAQQFWPIYNAYVNELKAVNKPRMKRPDMENLSEEEAAQLIDEYLEKESAKVTIKRKYTKQLSSAISQVKIAKLILAERKFKTELLKRARRQKQNRK